MGSSFPRKEPTAEAIARFLYRVFRIPTAASPLKNNIKKAALFDLRAATFAAEPPTSSRQKAQGPAGSHARLTMAKQKTPTRPGVRKMQEFVQ